MGPRKRSKPNPKTETESISEEALLYPAPKLQSQDPQKPGVGPSDLSGETDAVEPVHFSVNGANTVSAEDGHLVCDYVNFVQPQSSKTWYGGTWPRGNKANPVTQVAKESISAAGGVASEALASAGLRTPELPTTPLKSPALYLSRSIRSSTSSRSLPLAATTTKLHIISNAKSPMTGAAKKPPNTERDTSQEPKTRNGIITVPEAEYPEDGTPTSTPNDHDTRPESRNQASVVPDATNGSASWLNWFSKSEIATEVERSMAHPHGGGKSVDKNRPENSSSDALPDAPASPKQRRNSEPSPVSPSAEQEHAPRSWLSLWGNASTETKGSSSASALGLVPNPLEVSTELEPQNSKLLDAKTVPLSSPQRSKQPVDGAKSSYGWAFWSRDQPKSDDVKTRPGSKVGELALAGLSSQSKPESAVVDEAKGLPREVGKRQTRQSLEAADDPKKLGGIRNDAQQKVKPEVIPLAPKTNAQVDACPKAKAMPKNLLLPSFRSTYSTVERPSLIQQISRLLRTSSSSEPKRVDVVQYPLRVKRALAIVSLVQHVHPGFPSTWLICFW